MRHILYLSSWNFQSIRLLIQLALLFGVCGFTWFEAQRECRLIGKTLGWSSTSTTKPFWTGLHKRRSLWMQTLGCHKYSDEDPALKDSAVFDMNNYSSAGLCQELCMGEIQNMSFVFGIKDQNCFCFKHGKSTMSSHNSCKYGCMGTSSYGNGPKCSTYRTYLSVGRQRTDTFPASFRSCIVIECTSDTSYNFRYCESQFTAACQIQDSINSFYTSNLTNVISKSKSMHNASDYFTKEVGPLFKNTCKSSFTNGLEPVKITFCKYNYLRFDKGEMLSKFDKQNTMSCQLYKDGYQFEDCNINIEGNVCSKEKKTALKTTNVIPELSELNQTLLYSLDTTAPTNNDRESHSTTSFSFLALCLVPATSLICFAIGLFVLCRRRKRASIKTERTEKHNAPSTGKTKPNPTKDSKKGTLKIQISFKNSAYSLAENSRYEGSCGYMVDSSRFGEKFVYEMADNSKLEEEIPYTEAGEGHYDHLWDTASRRQIDEDIYNHLTNAGHVISGYDVMRKKFDDQHGKSDIQTHGHGYAYSCVTLDVDNKK